MDRRNGKHVSANKPVSETSTDIGLLGKTLMHNLKGDGLIEKFQDSIHQGGHQTVTDTQMPSVKCVPRLKSLG